MHQKAVRFLASQTFFYIIIGSFVLQAAWIALSGLYPMAFDEEFHFGLIRLYAHHLSPFLASQPPHNDMFGALYRDPSYLYHYLMSFPYRLISLVIHSEQAQVIVLRFINIALLVSGLGLWHRLLRRLGGSNALSNLTLLVFVLIPVLPLLAGQINYDNLFIPAVAYSLLLALEVRKKLAVRQLDVVLLMKLLIVCLLTCLVKYAFLPIFMAIVLWVGLSWYRADSSIKQSWRALLHSIHILPARARWLWLGIGVVALLLFAQRYAVNMVRYHSVIPACDKVLTVQQCSNYGPWNRDYNLAKSAASVTPNPFDFADDWLQGMDRRLFFMLAGPTVGYQTQTPLYVPITVASIFFAVGLVLLTAYSRRIFTGRFGLDRLFMLAVALIYILAIFYVDFKAYRHTGAPVAINGRYLLPVLLGLMLLVGLAYQELFKAWPKVKLLLAAVLVLGLLLGGGVATFIIRSNESWFWPHTPMRHVNYSTRQLLEVVVPTSTAPDFFWR